MLQTKYDYIVIGAGSGGIASANRAAMRGANVLLIEKSMIGGTCVNVGCVPKKVMWFGANIADAINKYSYDYGFDIKKNNFNWQRLIENRNAYIDRIHKSYQRVFNKNKVTLLHGSAHFLSKNTIEVDGKKYSANHVLIAIGGRAKIPEISGANFGIDSNGFFQLKKQPKRVAVVGAGYIAVEIASVLLSLGSQTNLLVRKEKPLRSFDDDLSSTFIEIFKEDGGVLHANSVPIKVEKNNDLSVTIFLQDGSSINADCLIWAIGRKPVTDKLNLEEIGVKCNREGFIITDEYQNTNVPGVYAVGDVIENGIQLTPVAVKSGRLLSERLFGQKTNVKMDYSLVPTVVFSHPPIGTIGLTEKEAIQKYGEKNIETFVTNFSSMYTAVTKFRQKTIFKLITCGVDQRIVGLHGIGVGMDEILQGFSVAIKMGATKHDFDKTVALHPTSAEEYVTMV